VTGDGLRPKSFAGLFGAALSVALATLALTVFKDGKAYAALEARSMIFPEDVLGGGGKAMLRYSPVAGRIHLNCATGIGFRGSDWPPGVISKSTSLRTLRSPRIVFASSVEH
jgi:hypothetical protein